MQPGRLRIHEPCLPKRHWRAMRALPVILLLPGIAHAASGSPGRSVSDAPPAFVDQLIADIEAEPARNPPAKIFRYQYDGREVYFVPAHCCDMTSELFTADGESLCSPDGGITGRGDGRCPDFHDTRSDETLIWEDRRKIGTK